MNARRIMSKFFPITRVAIISLCLALPWTCALVPRACSGLDTAEMAAVADQPGQELRSAAGIMKIYAIDVGQGDSALVVFPDGSNMLIDAGPSAKNIKSLLGRLGITKLNKIILTHDDGDHTGGYSSLQSGGYVDGSTQRYDWTNTSPGQYFYNNNVGASVLCVTSAGHIIGGAYVNPTGDNDMCVGAIVKFRGFDYLTCGDLEWGGSYADVEDPLGVALHNRGDHIDVYKVDHHGSKYGSSLNFLKNMMPEFAVIMVGSNGYGHPTQETINRLNDPTVHVQRIFQTETGAGGTASNVTVANGQIVITTNGVTYTFTNEGPGSTSFSYGPYQVDEPVCIGIEQPPHLMITEVGIGAHTFPENHDWVELYLPTDAQSLDLRSLYVTDLDYVSPVATNAVTLMPGDLVILHDAVGSSENDATGKGPNGWWDIFGEFSGYQTWNHYNDELVISSQNTLTPTQADMIDAVVWSNNDGSMLLDQAADGNYLIQACHWGDPVVGSGSFSTTNEGPAIGDINYGYAQRLTTEDTNSVLDWTIGATHSQGTPPPTPTPLPTQPPPIEVVLSSAHPSEGDGFSVSVIVQPIVDRPFDAYAVITGKAGTFSIQFGNRLRPGVVPIVTNIRSLPQGYSGVLLNMTIPGGVAGDYQVHAGFVDAGSKVKGPDSAFAYDVKRVTVR